LKHFLVQLLTAVDCEFAENWKSVRFTFLKREPNYPEFSILFGWFSVAFAKLLDQLSIKIAVNKWSANLHI